MKQRYANYDIVRIVAMTFVVGVHTLGVTGTASTPLENAYRIVCSPLLISANAVFFIISGHFNIRETADAKLPTYYYRKFRNILLPALVIFLVRTIWENHLALSPRGLAKAYILGSMGWYADTAYWFVYTLFGYLLASPFLYLFLSRLGKNGRKAFLLFGTLFCLANLIGNNIGLSFRWGYPFQGFFFTYCIGYYLDFILKSDNARQVLIWLGLPMFLITLALSRIGWSQGLNDISPFYTLFSLSLCLLILHVTRNARPNTVLSSIASHSFSVYLLHVLALDPINSFVTATFSGLGTIAMHLMATAIVLAISISASFLVDNLLVRPAQIMLDHVKILIMKETISASDE